MEQRVLGATGITVSVLGFGGAEIGFQGGTTASAKAIVATAIDNGITVFDTAAAYLESERLLGAALEGRREQITLISKCGALDGFSRSDWSKSGIIASIEQSLLNLRTDYLDVALLHSCGHLEFLMGEAALGLQEAKRRGLVRHIGYSGDGTSAYEALESGLFEVLETSVNVADQEALHLTLPLAAAQDIGVIAKRPLANVAWRWGGNPPPDAYHLRYWERLSQLRYEFQESPLAEGVGTALRFTLAQPAVSCAIVGTTKPERLVENALMLEAGPLTEDELFAIRDRWNEVSDLTWVGQV